MFECKVCGSRESVQRFLNRSFEKDGTPVLVQHIPARVCARCSDVTFEIHVSDHLRALVYGAGKPKRSISVDVYDYS